MRTTIKTGATEKKYFGAPFFCLEDLENEVEMATIIQEYVESLQSCTHCGASKASIQYEYRFPEAHARHVFYVVCKGHLCGIRTREWYATDDDENHDIRDILSLVCSWWNRRPGDIEKSYSLFSKDNNETTAQIRIQETPPIEVARMEE